MRITVGSRFTAKLAGPAALAMLLSLGTAAWAQEASSESVSDLRSEVQELQKEIHELKGEVQTVKSQQALVPPPPADQKPQTIGETVGSLGKSVDDIRTNLSTNLGIQVHGLADATYEYNLNHPSRPRVARVDRIRRRAVDGSTSCRRSISTRQLEPGAIQFAYRAGGGWWCRFRYRPELRRACECDGRLDAVFEPESGGSEQRRSRSDAGVPDLHGALWYRNLIAAGRIVTLLGRGIIPIYSNQNFNESRGLLFTLGEPLTHTGLRGTYAFNDKVSAVLGVNNGWDDVTDNNDGQWVEGELSLTPNANISLVLNGIYGPEQVNHGNSQRWAIDPVATWHTPITGLQLMGEYLYADEGKPISVAPAFSAW